MKELSIEEKVYDGNYKNYAELINRLEDVKEAIKKQNYGIAMDVLCKPYLEFQVTTHSELKESEDEMMIQYFKDLAPFDKAEELYEKYGFSHKAAIAWLEKQGEQKLTEWSEKDEKMMDIILNDINYAQKNFSDSKLTSYDKKVEWLKNKLKSLRPQNQWKPSKEQLLALRIAIGDEQGSDCCAILRSLLKDLKNL